MKTRHKHYIVCGLGRFGLHITDLLCKAGETVVVITNDSCPQEMCTRVEAIGARIISGDFCTASAREKADPASAAAIVLTTSQDVVNLQVALQIRGEFPSLAVVMRYSEQKLASRLEKDFGITAVLSPAVLAAGEFGHAALQAPIENQQVNRQSIRLPRWHIRGEFLLIPLILFLIYTSAVILFRNTLELSWIDAAYFTTSIVTTAGFGDFNLEHAPTWLKLFGIGLMFAGIMLIGIIASLLTLFIVSGSAMQLRSDFLASRKKGHVVVCGLGQVGVAIAKDLIDQGIAVVAVDPAATDDDHRELDLQCPLIVGDATKTTVLERAGIGKARSLIACTSNDALNLEIGLTAQTTIELSRSQRLRLVLRCFDYEVASRIHAISSDYILLSEAQFAAPVFVNRMIQKGSNAGVG